MATTAAQTVRDRVRAEMADEIKTVARRHLAEHGSAALSLRAVAREVGLVSSAVYRYFASRDDLLTALIIDAYDAVGAAAEATETSRRRPSSERWLAFSRAVRDWAASNVQEYALIYGSPVPGYTAPEATTVPAGRVTLVLLRLVAAGVAAGEIDGSDTGRLPRTVRSDLGALRTTVGLDIPDPVILRTLAVWSQLLGAIDLELFGHLHNVIGDTDAYFEVQMSQAGAFLVGGR